MSENKFGVKLADGTFIKGNLGYNNKVDPPSVMITMASSVATSHLADLMSTPKTSSMKYYLDYLAGEYVNCVFKSLIADQKMSGMVNVFFKGYIKGETNNGQESNESGADSGEEGSD